MTRTPAFLNSLQLQEKIMPTFKCGIASKVLGGMGIVIITAIISAGLVTLTLHNFQEAFSEIATLKLPGLIGASHLIRETERLIANAPDIIIAKNEYIRIRMGQDIEDRIKNRENLLIPLRKANISSQDIDLLSGQFDLVFANLKMLTEITSRQAETEYISRGILLRLYRISQNQTDVRIESGTNHNTIFDMWRISLNQAIIDMLFSATLHNDRELNILRKEFNSLIAKISTIPLSGLGATAESVKSELIRYGTGEQNVFDLRQNQIMLNKKMEENLIQNKFLSGELIKTATRIFSQIEKDIIEHNNRFDMVIREISILMISILVLGILIAVFSYLYVRKSIISRILTLGQCMRDHVEGRPVQIPISGADEITDMAASVDYFIQEIELREKKLAEAKKVAEVANHTKSAFLANMSHELRTPLNGVLGYAQILKRRPEANTFMKDGLDVIEQGGKHLLTLISDILDMSKIESGKMELHPVEFNFAGFLEGIIGIIRMRARQKGLFLVADLDRFLPETIFADETRLRQVLLNLLSNAVKFTDGGGTVTITVHSDNKGGQHVNNKDELPVNNELERDSSATPLTGQPQGTPITSLIFKVTDTGVGMTSEHKTNLFRPFTQVGDTSRRAEGTGLGLAISQQLVELMGGHIEVESNPGKGSVFWFETSFPVAGMQFSGPAVPSEKYITGYSGNPQTVLVVDDIAENRMVLTHLLEPLGFLVHVAENGRVALDMVETIKPDLILTDLVMPVMTGFELVNALRLSPDFQKTPILAVSASTYPLDESQSLNIGCDGFLSKPVGALKLFDFIAALLPIEWIYQEDIKFYEPEICSGKSDLVEIIFPPRAELENLYELAILGKVIKIKSFAVQLKEMDPRYSAFADKVCNMAVAFQDEQIINLIKSYIDKE